MKCDFLSPVLLFCALLPLIDAYAERGAAERVLYYYAYLAEEFTTPDVSQRKIGVGCLPGNARCNFNQFCEYIWAPRVQPPVVDNVRPTVTVLKPNENAESRSIASLYNSVLTWSDATSRNGITGNIDSGKLYAGATDYYDALRKISTPIGKLERIDPKKIKNKKDAKRFARVQERAPVAAQLVYDLRLKDLDPHRASRVAQILNLEPEEIVRSPVGRNTAGVLPTLNAMDAAATIEALKDTDKSVTREQFQNAIEAWKTGSKQAVEHWKALRAAGISVYLSKCSKME